MELSAGLVRFATKKYSSSKSSLGHRCMHLTNYSINKHAKSFQQPAPGVQGSSSRCRHDSSARDRSSQQRIGLQGQVECWSVQQQPGEEGEEEGDDGELQHRQPEQERHQTQQQQQHKWSFAQLKAHLQGLGHDWKQIWSKVGSLPCHCL